MRSTHRVFTLAAALTALVACGGSDNNNNNGGGTGALTARTLQGAITALTATTVTVNGVTTDDSAVASGKIVIDDNPSTHDQLKLGQVVTVRIDDSGKTTEIHHHAEVRGTMDDSTRTASSVNVGGQVVRVDDSTHFEDNTARLGGIAAGARVRVSGFPDDKGGLRATRIDRDTSSSNDFEIHGVVSALSGNTFTLKTSSSSTATYAVTATTLPAGLANGSFVEVRSATTPTAAGALTATSVKIDDESSLGSSNSEAEVEGIVLSGSSTSFVIRTRTVTTTAATKWVGGAPADLIVGVKVEAEGKLDASGNIAASKVVFHDSLRFQGAVSNVVPAAGADASKNGTFKMLNGTLTVHVSDVTEFDSNEIASLSALTTQNVEVRGYQTVAGGNDIVATRIKLGSGGGGGGGGGGSTRVVIQGPITNLDATAKTFQILGYTINGAAASSLSRDDNPLSNDSAVVFSGLANGTVVKARADAATALTGTTLVAKELELEDDK
jgi:hypothetical protein